MNGLSEDVKTIQLIRVCCSECGIVFGLPENYHRVRQEKGDRFICPNGHYQYYGTTRVQELEREIARKTAQLDQANASRDWAHKRREEAERSRNAIKGQVTKLKRRAAAGVCPCCNRQFKELAKHIETKHPEFIEESKSSD